MKSVVAAAPQVAPPHRTVASRLLQRQCACGSRAGSSGECEGCSTKRIVGLQTKMQVGLPSDAFEQEADRVADQVMTMSSARKGQDMEERSATPLVQRRVSNGAGGLSEAPSIVDDVLHSPGQQLDAATRAFFEPRFGYDFSRVRVHADLGATESARAVNASAYTVGQHVVFESSQFDPGSHGGRKLLAHELAHVIQQSKPRGSSATSVLEDEAKAVSARASESHQVSISGVVPQGVLLRQEAEDEGGSIQVIAKENGRIAVVLVRNGKIVQGYAEIVPPPGVSAADAVENNQVQAYATEVVARPKVDVVLPKKWARRQPVNPAAKVQIKEEEQVAHEAENMREAGERTEKVNQLRELYRAYLRDKTWDDCQGRGFCSAYGMSDDAILAVEEDDMFFEWMQLRQSEAAKHQVERENEDYRRRIDPTDMGFSGKDAREIIESNGPLDATPWERKHQFSGSLPNAIREDQTGLVTGYVLTEYRQVRLAGGVGEVIQIVVDRDGNEVERTSTTVLTPETEFVQDAARGLPVSSHVINFLEAGLGVSLDVRDPGRQLNEGENIDRAINTIPFADTVRTGEEVFSGVDLSDRGIQAQLEGDALILPEKVRIGKGILLGVEAVGALIGAKVKVNPKIHPKGAKLRPNSAPALAKPKLHMKEQMDAPRPRAVGAAAKDAGAPKPLPARRPPNKPVQKVKSPVAEKGLTTEKATVGPDAPKPKADIKQVGKATTSAAKKAVKDTGKKVAKVLDVTAEAVPVPKKAATAVADAPAALPTKVSSEASKPIAASAGKKASGTSAAAAQAPAASDPMRLNKAQRHRWVDENHPGAKDTSWTRNQSVVAMNERGVLVIQPEPGMLLNDARRKAAALADLAERGKLSTLRIGEKAATRTRVAPRFGDVSTPVSLSTRYRHDLIEVVHKRATAENWTKARKQALIERLVRRTEGDHVAELQLNGIDDVASNIWALDAYTNERLGGQISRQLANIPPGTRITEVRFGLSQALEAEQIVTKAAAGLAGKSRDRIIKIVDGEIVEFSAEEWARRSPRFKLVDGELVEVSEQEFINYAVGELLGDLKQEVLEQAVAPVKAVK